MRLSRWRNPRHRAGTEGSQHGMVERRAGLDVCGWASADRLSGSTFLDSRCLGPAAAVTLTVVPEVSCCRPP